MPSQKAGDGQVHLQRIHGLLSRSLYAGYLSFPQWRVHMVQGKHEPLIRFETYRRIQDKLNGAAPHRSARTRMMTSLCGALSCAAIADTP